jgi:DNA polymerase I
MKQHKLLLIDSSALIYRAFYALPPLTDRQGRVVNAVYGFMAAFINILKQTRPSHVIFAFDSPKPTHRKEKYVEYKAHREKAPDELYAQIPLSKELVKNLGFTELELAGFEADDIIATCAEDFLKKHPEGEVVVATGDLDTLQLINPKIKVFVLSRGVTESKIYDEKAVRERFGLEPKQMNDFKALFGDPSDNIKGVKGIGKKTAAELLQKFHTLEGIYENVDNLKPRQRELLEQEKEQAFLSRELVILEKNVPCEYDLKNTAYSADSFADKKNFLEELSFNSLARRVGELSNSKPASVAATPSPHQPAGAAEKVKEIIKINDPASLEKIKLDRFTLWSGETDKGKNLVIGTLDGSKLKALFLISKELLTQLDKLLPKDSAGFGFDLKEIAKEIYPAGRLIKKSDDLKIKVYLIQPPLIRKFGFKEILWHFLKERWEEPKKQMSLLESAKTGYSEGKVAELMNLLARLVPEIESAFTEQVTFQEQSQFIAEVFPAVADKVKECSIEYIYSKIEKPLSGVLAQMETAGINIDLRLLEDLRQKNAKNLEQLKKKILHLAGREFNLDSPSQLADVLFRDLKISSEDSKKGKSGHYSTAAGVLEKLTQKHPIISPLLEYREQRKFQTTYLEVIPKLVDQNGRLHTTFDQTGAATGRLSSNNPNLQNIPLQPLDGDTGIRHAFVAEKGFKLVSLDYSQIEIRLAAYLSGEEKLVESFEKGRDIHRETAAFVNQIDPVHVDKNMRNAAKALNFGIIYGMSPFGFSQSSKMPEHEARIFIQNYFREFPKIAGYMEKIKTFAREYGFVETIFGRRRYVPEVNLENRILRQAGERMAINMPLQGTAADIMKLALVAVNKFLEEKYVSPDTPPLERDVRILLSIHDEIILEVRDDMAEKVAKEVREIMENVAKDIIPLKVDVEIGKNWGNI